jgi:hypothetical protein
MAFVALSASAIAALSPADQLDYYRQEREVLKAALTRKNTRKVTIKPSEKGGVSMYGLGRFPVTLYESQWKALRDNLSLVFDLIDANREHFDAVAAKKGFNPEG